MVCDASSRSRHAPVIDRDLDRRRALPRGGGQLKLPDEAALQPRYVRSSSACVELPTRGLKVTIGCKQAVSRPRNLPSTPPRTLRGGGIPARGQGTGRAAHARQCADSLRNFPMTHSVDAILDATGLNCPRAGDDAAVKGPRPGIGLLKVIATDPSTAAASPKFCVSSATSWSSSRKRRAPISTGFARRPTRPSADPHPSRFSAAFHELVVPHPGGQHRIAEGSPSFTLRCQRTKVSGAQGSRSSPWP